MKKNMKNMKKDYPKKDYSDRTPRIVVKKQLGDIGSVHKGDIEISAKVNRVVQTTGPTVFGVSDGTGSLQLKGFIGPGARAYPEIDEGDYVKAQVKLGEFNGELEGDILRINKMDEAEKKQFAEHMVKIELDRAKINPPEFLVESVILDKLK